jgi:hypothetical protein
MSSKLSRPHSYADIAIAAVETARAQQALCGTLTIGP